MWSPEIWTGSLIAYAVMCGLVVVMAIACFITLLVLRPSLLRQGRDEDVAIGLLSCCILSGAAFFLVMGFPGRVASEDAERKEEAEWQAIVDREDPFTVKRPIDKSWALAEHERSKRIFFMRYDGLAELAAGERFALRQDGKERRVVLLPGLAPPPRLKSEKG